MSYTILWIPGNDTIIVAAADILMITYRDKHNCSNP